jgi:hypothetical protein
VGQKQGSRKSHFGQALHWSRAEIRWSVLFASGLGMASLVLAGALAGRVSLGFAAAVGSLLAGGGAGGGHGLRAQVRSEGRALVVAMLAAFAAVSIAWLPQGVADAALVAAGAIAATVGGYSRPLAEASGRFIVLLVVAFSVAEGAGGGPALLGAMVAGALWTSALGFLFGRFETGAAAPANVQSAVSLATSRQKFARWRRSLRELAGWQFTLRLALCLCAAGVLRLSWPEHRLIWVTLTVALLCQRQRDAFPVRTTQRALGVMLGVAATGVMIFTGVLPLPLLVAVIAVLAGVRPWLREKNYLAYSACMTPLIILILDRGQPIEVDTLVDRLLATVIGAVLVIVVNQAMEWIMWSHRPAA